jgi:hypothetical protein
VFVIGTSLIVQPFSLLPGYTSPKVPRILLNNDPVEDFTRPNDVFIQGDCDESVWKLCVKLGWHDQLRELHKKIGGVPREWDTSFNDLEQQGNEEETEGSKGTAVEDTVAQLTKELEEELRLDKEEDIEVLKVEENAETAKKDDENDDEKVLKSDTWDDNTVIVEKKDTATAAADKEESPKEVKEKL